MTEPPHIVLVLPLPPSANRMHRRGRTPAGLPIMHKADSYKAWLATAGWEAKAQAAGDSIPYRYHLRMVVPEQLKDPDNLVKPTQDLLQKVGVLANDKHLRRLVLEVDPARDVTMLLELWALPDAAPKRRPARQLRAANEWL